MAFGVGHRLLIDEERRDFHRPLPVFTAASGLGVLHAPRFDGGDYPFIVPAATFTRNVFQHALVDANVVVMLLARTLFFAVGLSHRECSALGCPISAKNGDKTGAFDKRHDIFCRGRTPEEGAPNAQ